MKKMQRWTTKNIPDQSGKTIIVTGANAGIGFETTLALSEKGAHVVMAVRSLERGQKAMDKIKAKFPDAKLSLVHLDLASLESVKTAVTEIKKNYKTIDVLINNAGSMTSRGKTKDGFELLIGVNHLGGFAFTLLLMDTILATQNSRIVNVSSITHLTAKPKFLDKDFRETNIGSMTAYKRSKLANLLFTYELQRRLSKMNTTTMSVSAHPGITYSEIIRDLPFFVRWLARLYMTKTNIGALSILRAAVDPAVLGGQFYGPHKRSQHRGWPTVVASNEDSYNAQSQQKLWALSEELTGVRWSQ